MDAVNASTGLPAQHASVHKSPTHTRAGTSCFVNSLEFDELHLETLFFDPCKEPMRSQVLQKLGVHQNARLEPIRGQMGSSNAGMWMLREGTQNFMLKLVRILPAFMGKPEVPESDKFAKLAREHPEMYKDPTLSFPLKVFHIVGKCGSKSHDLVVMHWIGGERFSDLIMHKLHAHTDQAEQELMYALERFGCFLASFHDRYNGLQHSDLTPANVFFDERTGKFTLVDVSGIAPRNPVIQADTDRFVSGLKLLSNFYGEELWAKGKVRFEAGYSSRRSRRLT